MATFELTCVVTVSAYTVVEADTLEDALEIAKDRDVVLGGFGGEDENEEWIIGDADGEPENIYAAAARRTTVKNQS